MNYFELFGLPQQFALDGGLLSSQFREQQKRCHPDNVATGSEQEKLAAVQMASLINDAYRVLKNPISRAEYILSLNGFELHSEQQTMQDHDFLMQQMLLREELEEIESSSNVEIELTDFSEKVSKLYKAQLYCVENELNTFQWSKSADTVRKLKFIAKLNDEIERVEEKLFG